MSFIRRLRDRLHGEFRIAVCFSGHPRAWKKVDPWWEEAFGSLGEIDTFCHFWGTDDGLTDHYRPVRYRIEPVVDARAMLMESARRKRFDQHGSVIEPVGAWAAEDFYSLMQVSQLKRSYEIERDFTYAMCVRARPDMRLVKPGRTLTRDIVRPEPQTLYTCHAGHDPNLHAYRIGEQFFYADSVTFDRVASFFRFMPCIKEGVTFRHDDVPVEFSLYFYTRMLGIHNHHVRGLDPEIAK